MTISEYVSSREQAFDRLKQSAPDKPVTHAALVAEIASMLREQSRPKENELDRAA